MKADTHTSKRLLVARYNRMRNISVVLTISTVIGFALLGIEAKQYELRQQIDFAFHTDELLKACFPAPELSYVDTEARCAGFKQYIMRRAGDKSKLPINVKG